MTVPRCDSAAGPWQIGVPGCSRCGCPTVRRLSHRFRVSVPCPSRWPDGRRWYAVSGLGSPRARATTLTDECRRLLATYQDLRRRLEEILARAWDAPEAAAQAGD